jgi:hypothetical protein
MSDEKSRAFFLGGGGGGVAVDREKGQPYREVGSLGGDD